MPNQSSEQSPSTLLRASIFAIKVLCGAFLFIIVPLPDKSFFQGYLVQAWYAQGVDIVAAYAWINEDIVLAEP